MGEGRPGLGLEHRPTLSQGDRLDEAARALDGMRKGWAARRSRASRAWRSTPSPTRPSASTAEQEGNTCVAFSTNTMHAQTDPVHALELTTGGHPGDPEHDQGPHRDRGGPR
ncbi:hypothetical protein ACF1DY_08320 [Streptomyces albus]